MRAFSSFEFSVRGHMLRRRTAIRTAAAFILGGTALFAVLSFAAGQTNGTRCPSDIRGRTVVYGGLCYQFVPAEKTWVNARQHCRQQSRISSGRLVNVPDAAAQRWLVTQMSIAGWTGNNGVWIGLHDRDNELHFVWDQYDGQDTPSRYTNWGQDEPDNSRNQNCVYMRRQFGWRWADVECNSQFRTYFFICQYRLVGNASPTIPARTAATNSAFQYSSVTSVRSAVSSAKIETPRISVSFSTLGALRMTTLTSLLQTSSDSEKDLTQLFSSSTAAHASGSLATMFERVTAKSASTFVTAADIPTASVQDQTTEGTRDGTVQLSSIKDNRLVTSYGFETAEPLTEPIVVYGETPSSALTKTSLPVEQEQHDATLSSRSSSEAPVAEASYSSDASQRNITESPSSSAFFTAADASNDLAATSATVPPADGTETAELRTVSSAVLTNDVTLLFTLKSTGNNPEFLLSSKTSNDVGLYVGVSVGAAMLLIGTVTAIALMKRTKMLQAGSRQNLVLRPAGIENPVYSAADHSESAEFYGHSNGSSEVHSTICSPESGLRFPLLKQVGRY